MSRFIVTLPDDPALAAQAHAAILAVPGVVGVEEAGRPLTTTSTRPDVWAQGFGPPPYTVADEDDGAP